MNAALGFASGLATGAAASYVVANIAIKRFFAGLNAVNEALGVSTEPEQPRLRLVGGEA